MVVHDPQNDDRGNRIDVDSAIGDTRDGRVRHAEYQAIRVHKGDSELLIAITLELMELEVRNVEPGT